MSHKVKNPITGRMITVGGKTYNHLVLIGKIKHKITYPPKSKERGIPTKGWAAMAPPKRERSAYKKRCGKKCLLKPESNGYPICDENCEPDCRGIQSAYRRARQYHHQDIANKALKARSKYC